MAARAALGALGGPPAAPTSSVSRSKAGLYDPEEVEALGGEAFFFESGGEKNDQFLDDELEELLEIGGDPTFLDAARETPPPPATTGDKWEWDGIEDETAYFDDDF